ncbi:MAG: GerMN domain-containing protein [Actinobacteria bacterium]|nr:GerMN domain-containing protein [Actinomycetota bacterium]
MELRSTSKWALRVLIILLLAALTVFAAWGCSRTEPAEPQDKEEAGEDTEGAAEEQETTVTLYFRYSADTQELLAPEERAVSGDPYLRAMQELIAGPAPDSQLYPVLPDTVQVLDIGVEDGICTVNVSKEILTDANQVGVSASGEWLALTAIANTLTQFAEVDKVKLLVEGVQSGMIEERFVEDFWGHMGLPEYLERNEDLIYSPPL